jgi:regulator of cell morphogenesis and NO signaling
MKITEALVRDHRSFRTEFEDLEQALKSGAQPEEIEEQLNVLTATLDTHAQLEDELLFALLEPQMEMAGALAGMRTDHGDIQAASLMCRSLRQEEVQLQQTADGAATTAEAVNQLLKVARPHFAKEEQILFPMAERLLDANTLEQLGVQFTNRRRMMMI